MIILIVTSVAITASICQGQNVLTPSRRRLHKMADVAKYKDAEHRGEHWYDYATDSKTSGMQSYGTSDGLDSDYSDSKTESDSSSASSAITSEKKAARRSNRRCNPCPLDMLKQWDNRGIKWICGQYQRARRSFKSECMMRFRNCQDGTMFVKMHDYRCKDNPYHGRHWFYIYKV